MSGQLLGVLLTRTVMSKLVVHPSGNLLTPLSVKSWPATTGSSFTYHAAAWAQFANVAITAVGSAPLRLKSRATRVGLTLPKPMPCLDPALLSSFAGSGLTPATWHF